MRAYQIAVHRQRGPCDGCDAQTACGEQETLHITPAIKHPIHPKITFAGHDRHMRRIKKPEILERPAARSRAVPQCDPDRVVKLPAALALAILELAEIAIGEGVVIGRGELSSNAHKARRESAPCRRLQ